MKRIVTFACFGGLTVALFGCPIYGDEGGGRPTSCRTGADCPSGYACQQGSCVNASGCTQPADCPQGSVCASDGTCRYGDCSQNGCVAGYTCKLVGGSPTCVGNGAADAGPTDAGTTECMMDSTCVATKGAGAKCLNGTCVGAADQCSDTTQCQAGFQCVQGVCTPSCSGTKPCPTGYTCDAQKGVCTGNPTPCTDNSMCTGGNLCVEGHCVAPCTNGSCGAGLVCVAGGCIPDQKPQFVCATEGQQDACKSGSLCLHHNCYIACDLDASMSCKNADQFNICKSVSTMTGTYSVCGSSANLGSDCDLTQGKSCSAGLICIDGYCR